MEQQDNKVIKTKESTSIPFFVHEGIRDAIRRVMEMM